ncbi:MAG: tubulin-like doman-containing protein [Dehalococcoidia bacterium]
MAGEVKRNFVPQFVGVGGTGVDIIAAFLKNRDLVMPLLQIEGVRISCLALDVADKNIDNLEDIYKSLLVDMEANMIPRDKVTVIAKSVKFPTPETMFDFIRQYPDYMKLEGARVPEDYDPWLSSAMEIPPLAGGVGRKRALSKAIYGLNFYLLRLIGDFLNTFKEPVFSSTLQSIVFVIYGLGGGSGSGMVMDLSRHLRKNLGSGVPIVGICVLPCPGDDPPAKGASAYASLMEHSLLLDRSNNALIKEKFGSFYENPFSAFLMIPLTPAFSQGKGLLYAWEIIDNAIPDMLINCFNFDPADLFSSIGSNVDLEGNWVHVLATVRVSYPVMEFIDMVKVYLEKLDRLRTLRKEKREMFWGVEVAETGGVYKILDICRSDLKEIYKRFLMSRNKYDPEKFDEVVENLIHEDRTVETDFIMFIRGVHDSIKSQAEELFRAAGTIGMEAPEGTLEARIRKLMSEFLDLEVQLPQRSHQFISRVPEIVGSLGADLLSSQLTPKQAQLAQDVADLANLITSYLASLRSYLETKKLAEKLARLLEQAAPSADRDRDLASIQKLLNPELITLFSLISSVFSPLSTEAKKMDEHLTNCRRVRRLLIEDEEKLGRMINSLDAQCMSADKEIARLEKDIARVRLSLFSPGKKKHLEDELGRVKHRADLWRQEMEGLREEADQIRAKITEYGGIEKRCDVNSTYRRLIAEIVDMSRAEYDKQQQMRQDKGFYHRVAELTEDEQRRLMLRILREDESALSRETILREIVDQEHLREYLVSILNLFRMPDSLGLTRDYRTDHLWFTIVAPPGIWSRDLEGDVITALSGYVKRDASRSIYIRQVESDDPWVVRFLLVAAKASPQYLSAYQDMKYLYQSSSEGERLLAHSLLLEQGIRVQDDMDLTYRLTFMDGERSSRSKDSGK